MPRWGAWTIYMALAACGLCWAVGVIWFVYGIHAFVAGLAVMAVLPLLRRLVGECRPGQFYLVCGGWCVVVIGASFAFLPVLLRVHHWAGGLPPDRAAMTWNLLAWDYGTTLLVFTALAAWRLLYEQRRDDARKAVLLNLAYLLPLASLAVDRSAPFLVPCALLAAGMVLAWRADIWIASRYAEEGPRSWILGNNKP